MSVIYTAFALSTTGQLERVEVETPPGPSEQPDAVRLRLLAGAICGSDLAKIRGVPDPRWPHDGEPGFPLHEIVGQVLEDPSGRFARGDRVVGMSSEFRGLAEEFYADPALLIPAPARLCDVHATTVQPLATILCSAARMPPRHGKRVAVVGFGGIGALFSHVLSPDAEIVVAIDPVDRSDVAATFGAIQPVPLTSRTAVSAGASNLIQADSFDLVVEAVGHQIGTFIDSVRLAKAGGHVVGFGVPDDEFYAVPMVEMFRKQLTVQLGETTNWRDHLQNASAHMVRHTAQLEHFVTDVYDFERAPDAFAAAVHPRAGQLKVAISASSGATSIDHGDCLFATPRRHTSQERKSTT